MEASQQNLKSIRIEYNYYDLWFSFSKKIACIRWKEPILENLVENSCVADQLLHTDDRLRYQQAAHRHRKHLIQLAKTILQVQQQLN